MLAEMFSPCKPLLDIDIRERWEVLVKGFVP